MKIFMNLRGIAGLFNENSGKFASILLILQLVFFNHTGS